MDRADLAGVETTPEGYLRIPARIAKEGILRYPSGRELVPASTLQDPDFLRSLEYKPLTLEHPPGPITPQTIKQYRVGTVMSPVEYRDGYVWATLQIESADAIKAVTEDGIEEVSPGYAVDIEEAAGTDPALGAYDRIQRKRRAGNHVALTQRARGGRDIRLDLRRDSQILEDEEVKLSPHILTLLAALSLRADAYKSDEEAVAAATEAAKTATTKADQDKAALQAEVTNLKAAIPAKEAELAAMRLRYNELLEAVESAAHVEHEMAEAEATPPDAGADAMVKPDGTKMDSKIAAKRLTNLAKIRAKIKGDGELMARVDALVADLKIEGADKMSYPAKIKAVAMRIDSATADNQTPDYYRAVLDLRRDSKSGGGRSLGDTLTGGARTDSDTTPRPPPSASKISHDALYKRV